MKDDPVFRTRFGEIAARVETLRAAADFSITKTQASIDEFGDVTPVLGAELMATQSLIHHEGTSLMDQLMMLSGSGSIYMSNRAQRRWRDLRCAAQHQSASIGSYSTYASALVDQAATKTAAPAQVKH
jgi:alkylation response protein AidB-like acyl-CoA dehydrogenase